MRKGRSRNLVSLSIFGILMSVSCLSLSNSLDIYPFQEPMQRQQFQGLLKELRCLVCQNQDLADSNAPLAKDLKKIVYDKVLQHQTNRQIKSFLTQRYGDFVLFKPPVNEQTYLLWFGPFIILLLGIIFLYRFVLKMREVND